MTRSSRRIPPRWTSAPGLPATPPFTGSGGASINDPPQQARHPPRPRPPGRRLDRVGRNLEAYPRRRLLGIMAAAVAFAVVGLVLGAQGHRSPSPDSAGTRPAAPDTPAEPAVPSLAPPKPDERPPQRAPALTVRRTSQLGIVVVDADGYTLYRFDDDAAGDASCTDACTSTWLPAAVDPSARLALDGVDSAEVGLIRRPDGTYQLTIGAWPVYRFAGDTAAGKQNGHGIGGRWFAITPTGEKAVPP